MKRKFCAGLAGAALLLNGCTPLIKDFRYPGGYGGYEMDRHLFPARDSKKVALLRYAIVLAIAAKIGERSVAQQDADAFAKQLGEAADYINYAADDLHIEPRPYEPCPVGTVPTPTAPAPTPAVMTTPTSATIPTVSPTPGATPPDCKSYYVNFESITPDIEERLVRAMLTSLPSDHARKFLAGVSKGNLLGASIEALRATAAIAYAAHRGSGAWRSGLEVLAAVTRNCAETDDSSYDSPHLRQYDQRKTPSIRPANASVFHNPVSSIRK